MIEEQIFRNSTPTVSIRSIPNIYFKNWIDAMRCDANITGPKRAIIVECRLRAHKANRSLSMTTPNVPKHSKALLRVQTEKKHSKYCCDLF